MSLEKIKTFTENASPDNWLKYSEELKEVAENLWINRGNYWYEITEGELEYTKRLSISRPFMLLAGLSMENCIKGYLVSKYPELVNKGYLDKKIKTHDLIILSSYCPELTFSIKEKQLFTILSEAINNWGRYPVPLNFNNNILEKFVDDEVRILFNKIYETIFKASLEIIKNGWDARNGISYPHIKYHKF